MAHFARFRAAEYRRSSSNRYCQNTRCSRSRVWRLAGVLAAAIVLSSIYGLSEGKADDHLRLSFGVGQIISVQEGEGAVFTLTLNTPYNSSDGCNTLWIPIYIIPGGSATSRVDYRIPKRPGGGEGEFATGTNYDAVAGFEHGQRAVTFRVFTDEDSFSEGDEYFDIGLDKSLLKNRCFDGEIGYPETARGWIVDDDDVRLSVSQLEIVEGGSRHYTVELTSDPSGEVTVLLSSSNQEVTLSPDHLEFTAGNAPQTVTVSAAEDDDAIDDTAILSHSVDGDVIARGTVSVTVQDNDVIGGVHLSVSRLTIVEGESGFYMVELTTNPDGAVIVTPQSDNLDVTILPESLTFTTRNEPQTFTVSTAQDDDTINNRVTINHSVTGYGNVTAAGPVSVTVIEGPPVDEIEKAAATNTLATVTASTVSNVTTNIGARFSSARGGTSLSLAGLAATQPGAFEDEPWDSLWNKRKGTSESHSWALSSDDLLRSTDFQVVLGASESAQAQAAAQWVLWGRGDLQYFSSDPDQGSGYDGDLRAGYLGVDMQVDEQWLAGVAVSRTMAKADYTLGISGAGNDGQMDVTLTSLLPYIRFAPNPKSELWAILGAGWGTVENKRPGATSAKETSDITMWMASTGGRRAVEIAEPLDWALLGDMGFGRVSTEDGVQAIAGVTVDVWRARMGVEGSYTAELEGGSTLTWFMEVANRFDGGDGDVEAGLELSPGLYFSDPYSGFSLEVRGRTLVLHSAENYEEYGLSATASLSPRSDGIGLSLSLSPRWGEYTGGADALWRNDGFGRLASRSRDPSAMSWDARVGYGIRGMNGLLTPFGEFGWWDEDSQRTRLGARYNQFHSESTALTLELSGERRESHAGDPEHRVGVIGLLRF